MTVETNTENLGSEQEETAATAVESTSQETNNEVSDQDTESETSSEPEYTPDYSFKYAVDGSKQQEAEFDEYLRGVIKDAETEKKVRDLYEKAYGLDFVKQDRDTYRDQFTNIDKTHSEMVNALQQAGAYVKHKDFDSYFQLMGIDKRDVLEYALNVAQYQQMTPEQRQHYDAQHQERSRLAQLELQNQQLTQNYEQFKISQREMELSNGLSRPEVASIAQAFDQRVGRPGAFRDEVIMRGQYYAYQGHDVPADQVITELVGIYGNPQGQAGATTQPQHQMQQGQQQTKPVIPNVQGKGTSPVKRVPRSIDDLKKLAAEKKAAAAM